ncbi:hypothetical protein [Faecalibacter bovis]|uniref:Uncharacterized protein n=1 Tax=Faecalibacter bovis TaxID=2898187 RepID=A0ABX7XBN6_9FLAO|nr:hypothetical protein [Faecalibacter bovis]QTV05302.1 hypothetical protein J9309_11025 [Faecalibacter bovis]
MDKYSFDRFIKQKNQNRLNKILKLVVTFLILSAISYVFIELEIFKGSNTAFYIFMIILATIAAYFNGYFKAPKEDLEGYFDGKITFTKDSISIGNDSYSIQDIESITIHNNDYVGKKLYEQHEFETKGKSQGVDNQLILDLGNRKFIEAEFKQYTLGEFEKMKKILISYHKADKLTFDDLVYIMKLEYDIDKNELKKQINKRS